MEGVGIASRFSGGAGGDVDDAAAVSDEWEVGLSHEGWVAGVGVEVGGEIV